MIYKIKTSWWKFQRNVKNFFHYGWKFRNTFDFDGSTLYEAQYYKLERLYNCMLHNSHLQWNSSPNTRLMRRLCEAKHLAKYLYDYNAAGLLGRNYRSFKDKYKKEDCWMDRHLNLYPDAKQIDDKLFNQFFKKAIEKDREHYDNTKRRLYYLLEKYGDSWWD